MVAAVFDGGLVGDELAVAGQRLDFSELSADGSLGECGCDGWGESSWVELLLYFENIALRAERDVFAAIGGDQLYLVGGLSGGDVFDACVNGGSGLEKALAALLNGSGQRWAGHRVFGSFDEREVGADGGGGRA